MCMLTQEWILEQHGLDGEKHKMRIKYLFYKIVRANFTGHMMQCQNLYKLSSKQTIQTICILIHMISFNFVLIIKKSDALHEHILHKIGVLFGLNSKSLTYLKSNRSSTAPVTFNIDSYKTYIIFVNHDGGNNSVVSLIYAESNPKLIELYRVGAVFT